MEVSSFAAVISFSHSNSIAGALGVLTLLIPVTLTWFTILYAIVGFSFSAAYGYLLFIKK